MLINVLGVPLHAITQEETLRVIDERVQRRQFTQHGAVNVAKLVKMQKDSDLYEAVASCDIVSIDGMGVVWGARLLGERVPERVTGIDLFARLLQLAAQRGYRIFLLGATPEVLDMLLARLARDLPSLQIAGSHHGYFWEDEQRVVEQIKRSGAQLLFVAMSSPKKEAFINRWNKGLGVTFVMGVGGSFDVLSGKVRRAPRWLQQHGLEWLFRLAQEPRRMWKRYLFTNAEFARLLLVEKVRRFRSEGKPAEP